MKKRRIHIFLCWAFVALNGLCYASEEEKQKQTINKWIVGSNFYHGFIVPHHTHMRILNERHVTAGDLYIAKKTSGAQAWHSFFNYPEYGLVVAAIDLGSPTYLGNAYCAYPYMNFPFLSNATSFIRLDFKIGAGIGYVEKIYHKKNNYKNIAIGSHLNAFINIQLRATANVSSSWAVSSGIGLMHLSNGSFKKPNLGLNIPSVSLGVQYAFGEQVFVRNLRNNYIRNDSIWHYNIWLSGGVKSYVIGSDKKMTSGLSLEVARRHLRYTQYAGTVEILYDPTDYESLVDADIQTNRFQTIKIGVTAGYEFYFGEKLSTNLQLGLYVYAKNKEYGLAYQRLSLRYALAQRMKLHLGLKTQLGQADYVELACAYSLR